MTTAPIDFAEIKEKLLDSILALAKELAPGGKVAGKYWISKNPTRHDEHAGSFWVLLSGPATGAWRDEATGEQGDVIDLVAYCKGLDKSDTRTWCLRWLGLSAGPLPKPDKAELERRAKQRDDVRRREEREEEKRRQKNRLSAFKLWLDAQKLSPATFAGSIVDRYLKGRGIDLVSGLIEARRELPGALRFFPMHDYHTADGEVLEFPCMIALMTGPDGKPRGVHRTWLAADGGGKAELPEPKINKARKIWPAGWQGGVIRIAKGAGNHTPEEAGRRGIAAPLIITEGIEDALAVALALPDRRVWAAVTLGNIGQVPVLPCVSKITVAADNDWNKKEAERALREGLAQLRKSGLPVKEARAPARFKDMNDLLKGETI